MSSTYALPRPGRRRGVALRSATRLFNLFTRLVAGSRWFPPYAIIEHRGRRSGKLFRTPVVVRPTRDGFVVPMPWGDTTDWYRNVRAAGGCVIRWRGRSYVMVDPEPVETRSVLGAFGGLSGLVARLGIEQCLRLRHRA